MTKLLSIAKDFSTILGGRRKEIYRYSGEEFLQDYFLPQLKKNKDDDLLELDLNGVEKGYPPSFLEEVFGGAIRKGYDIKKLIDEKKMKLICDDNDTLEEIQEIINLET